MPTHRQGVQAVGSVDAEGSGNGGVLGDADVGAGYAGAVIGNGDLGRTGADVDNGSHAQAVENH